MNSHLLLHLPVLMSVAACYNFRYCECLYKAVRSMRMIRSPSWLQYQRVQNLTAPCMVVVEDLLANWRKVQLLSLEVPLYMVPERLQPVI